MLLPPFRGQDLTGSTTKGRTSALTCSPRTGSGWWSSDASVPAGAAAIANQYAAMPSLHMAWALWCGAMVVRNAGRRRVKLVGVLYPLLTALVVLGTANHYLRDVVAGAVVWLGSTTIAHWPTTIGIVAEHRA